MEGGRQIQHLWVRPLCFWAFQVEIAYNESVDINPRNEHLNHNDDYNVDNVADGHKEEPSSWPNKERHNRKDERNDDNNLWGEQTYSKIQGLVY